MLSYNGGGGSRESQNLLTLPSPANNNILFYYFTRFHYFPCFIIFFHFFVAAANKPLPLLPSYSSSKYSYYGFIFFRAKTLLLAFVHIYDYPINDAVEGNFFLLIFHLLFDRHVSCCSLTPFFIFIINNKQRESSQHTQLILIFFDYMMGACGGGC